MNTRQICELLKRANNPIQEISFYQAIAGKYRCCCILAFRRCQRGGYTGFFGPEKLYLIKDVEGRYVGLVEDRGSSDLHWYTLPGYRRKGYLSTALREVILPHLFLNRSEKMITISHKVGDEADPLTSAS